MNDLLQATPSIDQLAHIIGDVAAPAFLLVLLHHKFRFDILLPIGAAQHGHRDKDLMMTTINRRRTVAMEFGM
jgi:hypothetical protein